MRTLLVCVLLAAPLLAQRDFLTADEADQIRDAQDPNDRLALYIHFARQRLSQVDHWLEKNKPGRSIFIHDALDDYSNIIDAVDTVSDDAFQRHIDISKGLKTVASAEAEMLLKLQKIEDRHPNDLDRYEFVLKESIDGTSDSLDSAREDPTKRAAEVAAEQAKEKSDLDQMMTPTERKERKAAEAATKPKRKAPTLLRPGEKAKDQQDQQ